MHWRCSVVWRISALLCCGFGVVFVISIFPCLSVESCGAVSDWYSVVVWFSMMDHLWLGFYCWVGPRWILVPGIVLYRHMGHTRSLVSPVYHVVVVVGMPYMCVVCGLIY